MPFNIKKQLVDFENFIKHPRKTILDRRMKTKGVNLVVYNEYNLRWLRDFDFNLILDIGAARGNYTIVFHELFPHAQIHAFEPLKLSFEKLDRAVIGRSGITIHNFALGRANEKKQMNISSLFDASSFLKINDCHLENFPGSDYLATSEVIIKTLDSLFDLSGSERIMIKMDTQGYEGEVIAGGVNIFKLASVAVIEVAFKSLYVGAPTFDYLYSVMRNLGYTFQGMMGQITHKADDSMLAADCIFVRSRN